ncbi:D-methionine transport system permease protein [Seinonella peptonophila]|uniref:D-methionine transport system permease protein n=1 Tax=Seinonella peptonophila TaxID=112248 RepID=A0A1M4U3U5_9BACL|nr:methionine ABC transporter permease [Seinonella peptonophila]SHE51345.1 D-methionine transport system permease protein [Seinonella peptonophila]
MLADVDWALIGQASLETLYMVSISTLFAALFGIPLGVLLVITEKGHLWEQPLIQSTLSLIVNIFRAVPFIVLVLFLFPVANFILNTSLGSTAATIPLIAGSAPFFARMVETAIREIDRGVMEAAQSMGASHFTIIRKVLLPEALPSIISGLTVTCVSLISFSAMAGIVGGGGLGDAAYRFGFQAYNDSMLFICGIILIILVQLVQGIGDWMSKHIDKR